MQKTYVPKAGDITQDWILIDANGQNLGRLATQIANILLGKNKPTYTPGVDTGDYVIVVNAERITVTGNKLEDKVYYRHTGYPGSAAPARTIRPGNRPPAPASCDPIGVALSA